MRYEVKLPDLGDESNDEAIVSYWLIDQDEKVNKGDDLIEMTTDKAAFSVPSPATGVLVEKLVDEGDEVSPGDVICVLDT